MAYTRNGIKFIIFLNKNWLWHVITIKKSNYLVYFYETTKITIKNKKNVGWIAMVQEQLMKMNLGNKEKSQNVLVNVMLPIVF